MWRRLTSNGTTGEARPTLQAHLLALQFEPPRAAVALQVQALAAQGQVAACHVQAPDGSQLTVTTLAVSIHTTYKKKSQSLDLYTHALEHVAVLGSISTS